MYIYNIVYICIHISFAVSVLVLAEYHKKLRSLALSGRRTGGREGRQVGRQAHASQTGKSQARRCVNPPRQSSWPKGKK